MSRARRTYANSHGLFCLARSDDHRDACGLAYPVAAGVRKPVVALLNRVAGSGRSTSCDPQKACAFSGATPANSQTAAPIVGDHEVERRAATDEEPVLREQPGGRI